LLGFQIVKINTALPWMVEGSMPEETDGRRLGETPC
jgi:hypothetical protein